MQAGLECIVPLVAGKRGLSSCGWPTSDESAAFGAHACRALRLGAVKADLLAVLVAGTVLMASCGVDRDSIVSVAEAEPLGIGEGTHEASAKTPPADRPTPSPAPTSTSIPRMTPPATVTRTAEPIPAATPTPTATPVRQRTCVDDPDAHAARIGELERAVASALEDYPGSFGFAFYDVDCDAMAAVNGDHVQYTASTGKLPFVIAALRAVEEGRLEFEQIEGDLELVLRQSLDDNANTIVGMLDSEEVWDVLRIAGVSEQTTFDDSWSNFFSTAPDLTLVWAALLRGDLLSPQWTDYVLGLASEAEVPPEFETFSVDADTSSLQFGQKAGYAVQLGPPYYLVGSGFLRSTSVPASGFAVTLVLTTGAGLADTQRREVFPLVVDFVLEAQAELAPGPQ